MRIGTALGSRRARDNIVVIEVPLDQLRDQDVVELITATWLDGAQKKSLLSGWSVELGLQLLVGLVRDRLSSHVMYTCPYLLRTVIRDQFMFSSFERDYIWSQEPVSSSESLLTPNIDHLVIILQHQRPFNYRIFSSV